mmetsp:Transcript_7089/g.12935  ORF Transcript_7089/g.12935 Transcript_7089/m.12935 type:complete len:93 (+) Transcript_7089:377-655(+)
MPVVEVLLWVPGLVDTVALRFLASTVLDMRGSRLAVLRRLAELNDLCNFVQAPAGGRVGTCLCLMVRSVTLAETRLMVRTPSSQGCVVGTRS